MGVAIITGASRGIGEQVAKQLALLKHSVVVNYAGRQELAEAVVAQILESGGQAVAVRADISNPDEVRELFESASEEFGPVTAVVNNAGVNLLKFKNLEDVDDDSFQHIFDVNTRGTFNMLREAARRLQAGGRIVSISSSVMPLAVAGLSVYAGSKAAIEAFSVILAKELRGREITVNCVSPGPTATEFFFQGKSDQAVQDFADLSPLERLGQPEEIANVVTFLLGPSGGWINGQVIRVNGGLV